MQLRRILGSVTQQKGDIVRLGALLIVIAAFLLILRGFILHHSEFVAGDTIAAGEPLYFHLDLLEDLFLSIALISFVFIIQRRALAAGLRIPHLRWLLAFGLLLFVTVLLDAFAILTVSKVDDVIAQLLGLVSIVGSIAVLLTIPSFGKRLEELFFSYRLAETKSTFISIASHQLRTPLTTIRWVLGRVRKNASADNARLLESALEASQHMSSTINAMLLLTEIETRRERLDYMSVDLHDLLKEQNNRWHRECAEKNLMLRFDCQPALLLRTHPSYLREILNILISNAIRYTPPGGSIDLSAAVRDERPEITVSDTGSGIPADEQKLVFQMFFRARNARERDPNGSGLGLALASRLAALLGASLTFASEEGKGSRFTLRFS
jgi:signal transduction histidine kinase